MTKSNRFLTRDRVMNTYITCVMLVLSFIAFHAFTTPMPTRAPDAQSVLSTQIPTARPGPPPVAAPVKKGEAFVLMEIPRFGEDWLWTALEGDTLDVLNLGPGHYPTTELPGEVGNSAFAAHRATHGDPFIDFDRLEVGDDVILSQVGAEWTYEITTKPKVVPANSKWVLDDFADGRWLTLTTCWPKYGSEKRMYVRAKLVKHSP